MSGPVDASRLTEILAESARSPRKYAKARLMMSVETGSALTDLWVAEERQSKPYSGPLRRTSPVDLYSIPVLYDNEIPYGAWRLVNVDGSEIERGNYPQRTWSLQARDVGEDRTEVRVTFDQFEVRQEVPTTGEVVGIRYLGSGRQTWSIPPDPGLGIHAVSDRNDDEWVRTENGRGLLWRRLHVVSPERETWETLLVDYGPLTNATHCKQSDGWHEWP